MDSKYVLTEHITNPRERGADYSIFLTRNYFIFFTTYDICTHFMLKYKESAFKTATLKITLSQKFESYCCFCS